MRLSVSQYGWFASRVVADRRGARIAQEPASSKQLVSKCSVDLNIGEQTVHRAIVIVIADPGVDDKSNRSKSGFDEKSGK